MHDIRNRRVHEHAKYLGIDVKPGCYLTHTMLRERYEQQLKANVKTTASIVCCVVFIIGIVVLKLAVGKL